MISVDISYVRNMNDEGRRGSRENKCKILSNLNLKCNGKLILTPSVYKHIRTKFITFLDKYLSSYLPI